jgi:hypothetical protein
LYFSKPYFFLKVREYEREERERVRGWKRDKREER